MKKIRPLPIRLAIFFTILIFFSAALSDEDGRYRRIKEALGKFTYLYPQQKVYLHMDKKEYHSGDVIWFKAYIVNGLNHNPDTFSTNLYVELISPARTRVEIKRLQMFKGFGIGDFLLSDTLPEGLYQIRAYTAWMQNFDTDFFFERNFQLTNPGYAKIISPKQARVNRKELKDRNEMNARIDLQFMPEGGYLVEGLESVVGFKAVNRLGRGVDIGGSVYDDKGREVSEFQTLYKGIGTFRLTPEKGRKYYAIAKGNYGDLKVALPQALETGLVMHVENASDRVLMNFATNRPVSQDPTANEIIVVVQTGGEICFNDIIRLENNKAKLEIPGKILPGGVTQITAFSGRGVPLAERLIFPNLNSGQMKIYYSASDSITEDGDKMVAVKIRTVDEKNRPLRANLSLSVTREFNGHDETNGDNIVSNLLLLSDLKGYIEDPMDYFRLPQNEYMRAIDNLMLTQGWRRFEWNAILAGEYPKIRYHEEKGITIAGKITRDFFNLPLENSKVQLSIMDEYNDVFEQFTSKKGIFIFENLVYYDTVSVKIEAWRPSGRRNLLIQLPENKENEVLNQQGSYTLTTYSARDKKAYRQEVFQKNKEAYQREKQAMEERRKNSLEGIYGEPDFVLYNEDFDMVNGNILDVMKGRVPGVQISGKDVQIRGINTLYGNTQPLYLVDGMPVHDVNAVTSIPIQDIERVEVLKGPKTSIYGSRGANGVIAVYTKRGKFMVRGKIEFDMLGYSTPRRFYQPIYEPGNEPGNNYTILWEPVIITDSNGNAAILMDKPSIGGGDYRFDLQGVSYEGHVGYLEEVNSNE